jgi:hypothetical protein
MAEPFHNKDNRGALFTNNDRNPHPKAPGHRGKATVVCPDCGGRHEFKISGWVERGRGGLQYVSLKFDQQERSARAGEHDDQPQQEPREF